MIGTLLLAHLTLYHSQPAASRPQLSGSTWVHWLNRNTALTFLLGRYILLPPAGAAVRQHFLFELFTLFRFES